MGMTTTLDRTFVADRPLFNPAPGTAAMAAIAAGALYLNVADSRRRGAPSSPTAAAAAFARRC
jgi:hypothetical protein